MYGRVAVIHDWLTGMRGGEKVLEAILEIVPDADLFTLFHDRGSVSRKIENRRIFVSSLDRWKKLAGDYRRLLPFYPRAVSQWDLSRYDLVISSSHCAAKGVNVPKGTPHLCYCHTPMRYMWDLFDDYFPPSKPLARSAAKMMAPRLRKWDVETAQRVDRFVANSRFVAERIDRIYGRPSRVIYPFVDDSFLDAFREGDRSDEHLIVSALVPYKKVELAIEAARIGGRKLAIIGSGPLLEPLRRSAPPQVRFLGWVDRETLIGTIRRARSLILPGVEDFGITPLEAMALGTPVVAYGDGGALETVQEEETGVFFRSMTADALLAALEAVESRVWRRSELLRRAAEFNRNRFVQEMREALDELVTK